MIHICGDSFASSDLQSNIIPWHEMLGECVNHAQPAASNLMISQQVDNAIETSANFIIVLFTSCCRYEHHSGPYSVANLDDWNNLSEEEKNIIKLHTKHFFDLDREIYRNQCIIESVLCRLVKSSIPFIFDQGGFEHKKWGTTKKYFKEYDQYRSKYNLWDYGNSRIYNPIFHVTDQNIHNEVANYFKDKMKYE